MRRGKLMDNMSKRIVPRTVLTVLLIIIIALAYNVQPVKAEPRNIIVTCGEGYLEYVNGLAVLHVKGSPYEMGYQNGFLLKNGIQAFIQYEIQTMIDMGYSYDYLNKCVQAMEPHIPQEYIEEMHGLADGASMNYTDVLIMQTIGDVKYYGHGWTGCSGFLVFGNTTVDGHLYHGRSFDSGLCTVGPIGVITVYEPEDGTDFLNISFPGCIGVHTGMNIEGITVENNLSSSSDKTLDGMPYGFMLKKALQYSNNLTDAIDVICQADRTDGWNILLGDGKNLNAAVVEISDNYCKVFWAGDSAEDVEPHYSIPNAVRRTNHYVDSELAVTQRSPYDPRVTWCKQSWDRYELLSQLIEDNYGNIDAQMAIEFLQTPPVAWAEINLLSVVFDSTDIELWVANSAYGIPAYQREFRYLSYDDLFPGYPVYLTTSSTAGGNVTTPGEGTFAYAEGMVVSLVAEADEDYRFVEWTATAGQFGDANTAGTNFTMPAQNVTVTANFEEVPSPVYPTVTTQAATGVLASSVTVNMDYTVGDFNLVQVRFAYKKSADLEWSYTDWVSKSGNGTHAKTLSPLDASTIYDFKAQLQYDATVIEGDTLQFTTGSIPLPPAPDLPIKNPHCFIATAAYGTPMASEIQILREFRDEYLLTNPLGRAFVDFYYRVSPPIAEFITDHPSLKPIVRAGLVPAVAMSTLAVNTTPLEKATIAGLVVLFSMAVAVLVIRRRVRGPDYT